MVNLRDYRPLRLLAADEQDLAVFSAVLQDAVMKIGDFAFLPERRRFAFVANRFVWECATDRAAGPFARVRAGCHFDDVLSVQYTQLRDDAKSAIVNLLAVRFVPGADGSGAVQLEFAGGGAIRLTVESINAQISDFSDPWPSRNRPDHKL